MKINASIGIFQYKSLYWKIDNFMELLIGERGHNGQQIQKWDSFFLTVIDPLNCIKHLQRDRRGMHVNKSFCIIYL